MNKYAKLREALRGLMVQPTVLLAAQVLSVEGDTCTVQLNDTQVDGVRLRPTGADITTKLLLTPKKGSFVLIGSQSGDFRDCNMLMAEEPETISIESEALNLLIDVAAGTVTINKGELGGLVKIKELNDNIASIKAFAESINSALPSAFNAIGAGTAANGASGAASYNGAMSGKSITIEDMEDPKVTH